MISFLFSASSSAEDVRLLLPSLSPRSRLLRMRGLLLQGGPGFAVCARKEPVFHPCPEIEVVQTFKANLVTVSFVSFVIGICDCSFCFGVLKFQIQSMVLQL